MSEHLLATMDQGVSTLAGGDKVQLMVHIDANSIVNGETLNSEGDKTHCYLDGGPFLCPDTAHRLACDAGIMTVLEDSDGNVLNVGRKSRTVPTRLRRALELRDQGRPARDVVFPVVWNRERMRTISNTGVMAGRPVFKILCSYASITMSCCMRENIVYMSMMTNNSYS
jgi:hypothetical protein